MRKLLLVIIAAVAIAAGFCAVITAYRHQARDDLARAEVLEADLQKLRVGTSDYKAARVIATKFGTIPYESDWGTRDCTAGYFERCTYTMPSNHNQWSKDRLLLTTWPSIRSTPLEIGRKKEI